MSRDALLMLIVIAIALMFAACTDDEADVGLRLPAATQPAPDVPLRHFESEAQAARAKHFWLEENLKQYTTGPAPASDTVPQSASR
jgi:hypothetical protein